jgi:hypothetical protein
MGFSIIANEQFEPTEMTKEQVLHSLDYLATHPHAIVRFYKLDIILIIHSNTSYLSPQCTQST